VEPLEGLGSQSFVSMPTTLELLAAGHDLPVDELAYGLHHVHLFVTAGIQRPEMLPSQIRYRQHG
jgi:hypothetical protein